MNIPIPSARNLEIYHRLSDDAESVRVVAREFGLSPTRVVEISSQVQRWYKCAAPDWELDGKFRRQHAVSACKRHEERAQRMYGRMMDAFRDSQGEEQKTRATLGGGSVTTTSTCHGDPKFLTTALRYSREQMNTALTVAKLPDEYFVPPEVEFVEPSAEELAREAAETNAGLQGESPDRVCTVPANASSISHLLPGAASDATADADTASEVTAILAREQRRDAKRQTDPVQSGDRSVLARRRDLARALAG
jgi:hypothetical protein